MLVPERVFNAENSSTDSIIINSRSQILEEAMRYFNEAIGGNGSIIPDREKERLKGFRFRLIRPFPINSFIGNNNVLVIPENADEVCEADVEYFVLSAVCQEQLIDKVMAIQPEIRSQLIVIFNGIDRKQVVDLQQIIKGAIWFNTTVREWHNVKDAAELYILKHKDKLRQKQILTLQDTIKENHRLMDKLLEELKIMEEMESTAEMERQKLLAEKEEFKSTAEMERQKLLAEKEELTSIAEMERQKRIEGEREIKKLQDKIASMKIN